MHATFNELIIRTPAYQDELLEFLEAIFPQAIEIMSDRLIIRSEEALEDITWGIEEFARALEMSKSVPVSFAVTETVKPNRDWIEAYRAGIKPVRCGTFYVRPSWEAPQEDAIDLVIDPALAFGSGSHETTASCLEALGNYVQRGDYVADIGCGSGILGIAAAKLGALVDACDTDPLAVESARKNFQINHAEYRTVLQGSAAGFSDTYDLVAANIVADILVLIAKDLKRLIKPGGLLILSGILAKNIDSVKTAYATLHLLETVAANEWRTLIYRKETDGR